MSPSGVHENTEAKLTVEQRQKFMAAAERGLRPRRAIITLAAHASGHTCGPRRSCKVCHASWPCAWVMDTAHEALAAVADLTDDPWRDLPPGVLYDDMPYPKDAEGNPVPLRPSPTGTSS